MKTPVHSRIHLVFTWLSVCLFSAALAHAEPRLLVYQKNGQGFVHDNLAASAAAIRELGELNGFAVDVSTNASVFTDKNLARYQALVFANSNNEAFDNDEQRAVFQKFIKKGGGFVGVHSSTGSERQWEWFQNMQGAKFLRHPPIQPFTIKVQEPDHPAAGHLGHEWRWIDECYFFEILNPSVRVILSLKTETLLLDPQLKTQPGHQVEGVFPLAWCQELYGGRQFYTALGHKIEYYADPNYRQHLLGGILWTLRLEDSSSKLPD